MVAGFMMSNLLRGRGRGARYCNEKGCTEIAACIWRGGEYCTHHGWVRHDRDCKIYKRCSWHGERCAYIR